MVALDIVKIYHYVDYAFSKELTCGTDIDTYAQVTHLLTSNKYSINCYHCLRKLAGHTDPAVEATSAVEPNPQTEVSPVSETIQKRAATYGWLKDRGFTTAEISSILEGNSKW